MLEQLQGLADQVAQIQSLSLTVLYLIANAGVVVAEDVENGQDLAVVRYQRLADHLAR